MTEATEATDVQTLTDAARELRLRRDGLPAHLNEQLAEVLDQWARMGGWAPALLGRNGGRETVALAASIAQLGQARSCECGRAPDPGICQHDCAPGQPAGGHCTCAHEGTTA